MLTAVMQGKNHTTVTEFRYAIAFWLSRLPPPFDYRIPYLGDGFPVSIREDEKECCHCGVCAAKSLINPAPSGVADKWSFHDH